MSNIDVALEVAKFVVETKWLVRGDWKVEHREGISGNIVSTVHYQDPAGIKTPILAVVRRTESANIRRNLLSVELTLTTDTLLLPNAMQEDMLYVLSTVVLQCGLNYTFILDDDPSIINNTGMIVVDNRIPRYFLKPGLNKLYGSK